MNTSSDSTTTVYDFKSLIFAGNFSILPVSQLNCAPCHPHVIVEFSKFPSDKLAPECVHVSSHAK